MGVSGKISCHLIEANCEGAFVSSHFAVDNLTETVIIW